MVYTFTVADRFNPFPWQDRGDPIYLRAPSGSPVTPISQAAQRLRVVRSRV